MGSDVVPYVEDGLAALVEASYRSVVGRPPTRAEKLTTVAGLQADPQQARVLADLLGSGRALLSDLLPPSDGPAWR